MEKSEMYRFAENELNILLEMERESNKKESVGDLERECEIFDGKTMQESINADILEIIDVISRQNHSGSSIWYLMDTVNRLVRFENLTPLKLTDDEFEEVARADEEGCIFQNKRNFKVFKSDKLGIYHLDGKAALDAACGIVEGEDKNE